MLLMYETTTLNEKHDTDRVNDTGRYYKLITILISVTQERH
jgi:hypothetical protein